MLFFYKTPLETCTMVEIRFVNRFFFFFISPIQKYLLKAIYREFAGLGCSTYKNNITVF